MNLISPIPVTTVFGYIPPSETGINLPLCACALIDRRFMPHTKAEEAGLGYHDTIIDAEPILF